MKNKLILTLIILVMLILNSCGNNPSQEEGVLPQEYEAKGTFPIVEEPITINVWVRPSQYNENLNISEFTKFMEKKTNIKVNYIYKDNITVKDIEEAYKNNSDDCPDAFLDPYSLDNSLLMPLKKYYNEEYMPNLMKALEDIPYGIKPLVEADGEIYGLPSIYEKSIYSTFYYDKELLEKAGFSKPPKTTEEFYQYLKKIKSTDLNNNGEADEIPLTGVLEFPVGIDSLIMNAFCYYDINCINSDWDADRCGYVISNDKISTIANTDDYREGLSYINKLYKEGLIYKDSFDLSVEEMNKVFKDNKDLIRVFSNATFPDDAFGYNYKNLDSNVDSMEPLIGPKNVQNAYSEHIINDCALKISSQTQHTEAILRYYDYMYSLEGALRAGEGPKNEFWVWANDSDVAIDGKRALWKQLKRLDWNNKTKKYQHYPFYETSLIETSKACTNFSYYKSYVSYYKKYRPYENRELKVPRLNYSRTEQDEYDKYKLAEYIKKSALEFMKGTLDVNDDTVWNDYKQKLLDLHLNEILELKTKVYQRQYK